MVRPCVARRPDGACCGRRRAVVLDSISNSIRPESRSPAEAGPIRSRGTASRGSAPERFMAMRRSSSGSTSRMPCVRIRRRSLGPRRARAETRCPRRVMRLRLSGAPSDPAFAQNFRPEGKPMAGAHELNTPASPAEGFHKHLIRETVSHELMRNCV
jgi:hypothetical protein